MPTPSWRWSGASCSASTSSSAPHDEESANRTVDNLADAYQEAGGSIDVRRAITSFCRWGQESLALHLAGRATNARSEGVNNKIECLERMAYGFSKRVNYEARVLLVCSGHPPNSPK